MVKARRKAAIAMVAIGFLAQNCAIGLIVSSFGPALAAMEAQVDQPRGNVSTAFSLYFLALGLAAPLVGNLLGRISLRVSMIIGALLCSVGNILVAYAESLMAICVAYGLLIGPGACMMGVIPVATLLARWLPDSYGRAMGIANMPFFLLIIPPLASRLMVMGGTHLLYTALAIVFLALVPLFLLVRDPRGRNAADPVGKTNEAAKIGMRTFAADGRFWLISAAIGLIAGIGTVYSVHIMSLVTMKGIDLTSASLMLSLFGAGSLAGAFVFGFLSDRLGPLPVLAANAVIQAAIWILLLVAAAPLALFALASAMGFCLGALFLLHGAALGRLFGLPAISEAMGYSYFLKVPFLFGAAPIAGYLYDARGNYDLVVVLCCAGTLLAAAFVAMIHARRGARAPSSLAA